MKGWHRIRAMKTKATKEVNARRAEGKPLKPSKKYQDSKGFKLDWKFWVALFVGIVGAVLTAIGLQARPSISLEPPLNPNDVFTSQFVISNDGWLDLNRVHVFAYAKEIRYDHGMVMKDLRGTEDPYMSHTLTIGERQTVPWPNIF